MGGNITFAGSKHALYRENVHSKWLKGYICK